MEINALVPGDIEMVGGLNPKTGLWEYKPVLDLSNPEHELAFEYGEAVRIAMETAMEISFKDYLHSDMPGKSELALAKYWKH